MFAQHSSDRSVPITDARRLERVRQNLRVIEYRTPAEIEQMRPAGRFVAEVLSALIARADVGVNLLELDELAHQMIRDRGAESCYINYHPSFGASPFGKVLCTSVNDAVLHGLPHDYELVDGDLISLDFAASVNGWVSDSAISVIVGSPREQDQQLIATAEAALAAGIEAAVAREQDRRHLVRHRTCRVAGGLQDQHRVRRAWCGPYHARRPPRTEQRPAWPGAAAPARPGDRDRAVVPGRHRQDLHRS